jgi:hypothetical protein
VNSFRHSSRDTDKSQPSAMLDESGGNERWMIWTSGRFSASRGIAKKLMSAPEIGSRDPSSRVVSNFRGFALHPRQ